MSQTICARNIECSLSLLTLSSIYNVINSVFIIYLWSIYNVAHRVFIIAYKQSAPQHRTPPQLFAFNILIAPKRTQVNVSKQEYRDLVVAFINSPAWRFTWQKNYLFRTNCGGSRRTVSAKLVELRVWKEVSGSWLLVKKVELKDLSPESQRRFVACNSAAYLANSKTNVYSRQQRRKTLCTLLLFLQSFLPAASDCQIHLKSVRAWLWRGHYHHLRQG